MNFDKLFHNTQKRPIKYGGKLITRYDRLSIKEGSNIRINIEKYSNIYKQGVALDVDGQFEINGKQYKNKIVLWGPTCPKNLELIVLSDKPTFGLKNVWMNKNGSIEAWTGGAAMYSEDIPNGKRYFCNDCDNDDDFNDIIFTVTRLNSDKP